MALNRQDRRYIFFDIAGLTGFVSHHPDHPALQALLHSSYEAQAAGLLAERRQRGLPPAGQLALIRSDCSDARAGENFLFKLRTLIQGQLPAGVALVGPLPAPMHRRAGKFRSHLLLQGTKRGAVLAACALAVYQAEQQRPPKDCKWSIDVDPTEPL